MYKWTQIFKIKLLLDLLYISAVQKIPYWDELKMWMYLHGLPGIVIENIIYCEKSKRSFTKYLKYMSSDYIIFLTVILYRA